MSKFVLMAVFAFTPGADMPGITGLLEATRASEVVDCEEYETVEIDVHFDQALSRRQGVIVIEPATWGSLNERKLCGPGEPVLVIDASGERHPVPQDMHGYEEFGFLVTDRSPGAFEIQLDGMTGWVAPEGMHFHPVRSLLERAPYFIPGRELPFCAAPGKDCQPIEAPRGVFNSVVVHEWKETDDGTWLDATINVISGCFDTQMREIENRGIPASVRGWVPLRDDGERLNFWFAAKGC